MSNELSYLFVAMLHAGLLWREQSLAEPERRVLELLVNGVLN